MEQRQLNLPGPTCYQRAVALLGKEGLRTAVRSGRVVRLWRGVFAPADRAREVATLAEAALVLVGPEAVISGPTAAALYGCTALPVDQIHLTIPYTSWCRSRSGLAIHHDRFRSTDVTMLNQLPIMVPGYVVAELLCRKPRRDVFACADQMFARFPLAQREEFRRQVNDYLDRRDNRKGVPDAHWLLQLLTGKAESPMESSTLLVLMEADLPLPELQYEILDMSGRVLYRLDFAWPEYRVAVEYDGYAAHEQRWEADAERDRRMAARGWLTIRATVADLHEPDRLIHTVRQALEKQQRRLA